MTVEDISENEPDLTLLGVVSELGRFNDELTIYARKPWTRDSAAILEMEPEEGGLPARAVDGGFDYFIEVFIAAEILGDWSRSLPTPPSEQEMCDVLIRYAIYDA